MKLTLTVVAVTAVVLPAVAIYTARVVRQDRLSTIEESVASQLRLVDVLVSDFLDQVSFDVETLARNELVRERDDGGFTSFLDADESTFEYRMGPAEQRIVDLFRTYRDTHPYVSSVYMGRENGSFVRSHPRSRPTRYDPRTRPWYGRALEDPGQVLRTAPYRAVTTDDINIGTVRALVDEAGQVFGVVGIDVTLRGLTEFIAGLHVGQRGYIVLLDESHTLVTNRDDSGVASHIARSAGEVATASGDIRALSTPSAYVYAHPSPELGWIICAAIPHEEIDSQVRRSVAGAIFWVIATLVFLSLLTSVGVRQFIVRPTHQLQQSIERVTAGDLHQQVPVRTSDEIGRLAATFNSMLKGLRERDFIRETLGRYITDEVARRILADPKTLRLGGEDRVVTILMSDLRGFTSLSERLSSTQVVALLNRYLSRMADVIMAHEGIIIEFIGDGILVVFGLIEPKEDDALRAVACAIAMQRALDEFNREQQGELPVLQMGIGVNTGRVVVGNVGSERRMKYGVVGDAVNVAARIESTTIGNQVLISDATLEQVQQRVTAGRTSRHRFKGKHEPVAVHEILAVGPPFELEMPANKARNWFPVELPAMVHVIVDKQIEPAGLPSTIVQLDVDAAVVQLEADLPSYTQVKLRFIVEGGERPVVFDDLYGSVIRSERQGEGWSVELALTSVPDPAALDALRAGGVAGERLS
ncbi:MAG: HAMP domain-containing protein [Bradymonadales bacterium]|nr:HAMP domain-containing protein [Bradymonadales bacterium]